MTPEARYRQIREMSNVFENKSMMKNLLIRHLSEAVKEAYLDAASLIELPMGASAEPPEMAVREITNAIAARIRARASELK